MKLRSLYLSEMEENLMKETIKGICHALVTYHVSHDKFVWIVKTLIRIHVMYTNYLLHSYQGGSIIF